MIEHRQSFEMQSARDEGNRWLVNDFSTGVRSEVSVEWAEVIRKDHRSDL